LERLQNDSRAEPRPDRRAAERPGLIMIAGGKTQREGQHAGGVLTATTVLNRSGFASHFDVHHIDTTSVDFPPESFFFKVRKGLRRLMRFVWITVSSRPRALLAWASGGFSVYEKLFLCALARVFGMRSALLYVDSLYFARIEKSRLRWLHRRLFSIPNRLICRSKTWVENYGRLGVAPDKCVIIKNWIDLTEYVPCRKPQPKGTGLVFLYVGWLIKEKGTTELIEAIRLAAPRLPGAKWILVGGGKEEDRLRGLVSQYGLNDRVEMTGWKERDEMFAYYARAHVLVLPSYGEGFPYAIIEAMSAGLPIITTPVGGIPGNFREGEHGLYVPPRDAGRLADAMVQMAEDWEFRNRVSKLVTEYVESNHDVNAVWPQLARILDSGMTEAGRTDFAGEHSR
jgi:glycosyltransferase involved in cell wall biosynthesis